MPSPLGHAIGGAIAGAIICGPAATRRQVVTRGLVFAAVAMAPDLDLLVGRHRSESHSLGAAILVASMAAAVPWPTVIPRWRIWLAVTLAWSSHLLLDSLGGDTSPPGGVMAWWPFSSEYVKSSVELFMPISRRWRRPGFLEHTAAAVALELVLLVPWLWLAGWWRWPRANGVRRELTAISRE